MLKAETTRNDVQIGLFYSNNKGIYYLKSFKRWQFGVRPGNKIRDLTAYEIDNYIQTYLWGLIVRVDWEKIL